MKKFMPVIFGVLAGLIVMGCIVKLGYNSQNDEEIERIEMATEQLEDMLKEDNNDMMYTTCYYNKKTNECELNIQTEYKYEYCEGMKGNETYLSFFDIKKQTESFYDYVGYPDVEVVISMYSVEGKLIFEV